MIKETNMNVSTIIDRLHAAAMASTNDRESNFISALANRLEHRSSLFEKDLTRTEIAMISRYAGLA
jgi:hypothetical protein